jgi:hypothetical protein
MQPITRLRQKFALEEEAREVSQEAREVSQEAWEVSQKAWEEYHKAPHGSTAVCSTREIILSFY